MRFLSGAEPESVHVEHPCHSKLSSRSRDPAFQTSLSFSLQLQNLDLKGKMQNLKESLSKLPSRFSRVERNKSRKNVETSLSEYQGAPMSEYRFQENGPFSRVNQTEVAQDESPPINQRRKRTPLLDLRKTLTLPKTNYL